MLCPFCNEEISGGAVKCRFCGEWLEEDMRKKVSGDKLLEEKKLERERIRERDRQKSRQSLGCCALIFLPFVFILIVLNLGSHGSPATTASPTPTVDAQKAKESAVSDLAPKYCSTHQKTTVWFDKSLQDEGWPAHSRAGQTGFTQDQCKAIISKLYDVDSSAAELQDVIDSKYWVGQDYRLLAYSIGTSQKDNQTQTAFGTQHQFVYDWYPKTVYVYLEGGKVTSIQN